MSRRSHDDGDGDDGGDVMMVVKRAHDEMHCITMTFVMDDDEVMMMKTYTVVRTSVDIVHETIHVIVIGRSIRVGEVITEGNQQIAMSVPAVPLLRHLHLSEGQKESVVYNESPLRLPLGPRPNFRQSSSRWGWSNESP